jgi:hypothetical protein
MPHLLTKWLEGWMLGEFFISEKIEDDWIRIMGWLDSWIIWMMIIIIMIMIGDGRDDGWRCLMRSYMWRNNAIWMTCLGSSGPFSLGGDTPTHQPRLLVVLFNIQHSELWLPATPAYLGIGPAVSLNG